MNSERDGLARSLQTRLARRAKAIGVDLPPLTEIVIRIRRLVALPLASAFQRMEKS